MAADASTHGMGALISHRFTNQKEKAMMHTVRFLTAAEQNYSQIEKGGISPNFHHAEVSQNVIWLSIQSSDRPQTTFLSTDKWKGRTIC